MATSICIHDVQSVTTDGVTEHNSNALTLRIKTQEGAFDVTLFGLSGEVAKYIDRALSRKGFIAAFTEQVPA